MGNLFKRMVGLRRGRRGQTTAEYALIVAIVAIASIAVVLAFGNQIREVFFKSSQQLAGEEDATVDNVSEDAEGSVSREDAVDWGN